MPATRAERDVEVEARGSGWTGTFMAMGSPCEVLIDGGRESEAVDLTRLVAAEAWRIEDKFSRYLPDSVLSRINSSSGKPVEADPETARLLDFSAELYALSDGGFDVTSGVLRRVWTFDGSDRVPAASEVSEVLAHVGWHRVDWDGRTIRLPRGMEIDFGGIGKEYAVDRAAGILRHESSLGSLVNFGGDLAVATATAHGDGWHVGVDSATGTTLQGDTVIALRSGALATSGDARRYLLRDGVRYGHIIDPTTGWPVESAPRSVTVAAETCTQAGMLSTIAMLKGEKAEAFLDTEGVRHWCERA